MLDLNTSEDRAFRQRVKIMFWSCIIGGLCIGTGVLAIIGAIYQHFHG